MNNFVKHLMAGAIALSLAAAAMAQTAGPSEGAPKTDGKMGGHRGAGGARGQMLEKALAKLNLTSDQKRSIFDLNAKFRSDFKQLMETIKSTGGSREENREKVQALMKAHMKAIVEVLTPGQRKELKREMKAARDKMADRKADKKEDKGDGEGKEGAKP